jgi:hypothetical protein
MPTILELFKDPSKWQFGTNYKNSVKDDKNIIETIASKTSKIRRQTGVDLNNPLIYGTGAIRIANRTLQTTELQKSARFDDGTTEPASGGGLLGDGLSKLSGGKINSLSEARDELSSKLGLPSKLIPSKIVSDPIFLDGQEQDTISTLETIKNNGEGSELGKFLKQTGGGNPKTIGREAVGGGIGIVKDKVRNAAFGEPQTLREVTGQKLQDNYSSTQKYSEISQDGDSLRDYKNEGGDTNIKYANQSTDVINLDDVSPVNRINRKPQSNYEKTRGRRIYSYNDESPRFRGKKTLAQRKFSDKFNSEGDKILKSGPNDDYSKDEMVDNQLIPFWVSGLDSTKPVFFRTVVSGITENVTPSWGSSKFIGNPYNFYTYSGVERSVSLQLELYCNNPTELAKNWEKVEYLTSKTYPSINKNLSFVDAPFIKFRLGNIYNEKIAFIESLTYTIPDNGNWETELDGFYLPKYISVALSFKFVEQEGSENALYNYSRSQEAIKQIKDKQTISEENKTTTTITTETTEVPGINSDGTNQTEPPSSPSGNKNLNGGKSVDENNQDEVKKSSSTTNISTNIKEKYEIRIELRPERGKYFVSVYVPTETNNPRIYRESFYTDEWTREELKSEMARRARKYGFERNVEGTGRQIFQPSDDITFS